MFSAITRRVLLVSGLVAGLIVAGCANNKEPDQRRAFILFLQTRVLTDAPATVPAMTAQDREDFGPYAEAYQVLFDFSKTLNDTTIAYNDANTRLQSNLNNMKALQDNWQQLATLRKSLLQTGRRMAAEYDKVQTFHASLQLPDDVRGVYDQVFAALVTTPGDPFRRILVPWDKTLQASEDLGHFLYDNSAQVRIAGSTIQLQDTALKPEWSRLQENYQLEIQGLQPLIQALATALAPSSANHDSKSPNQDLPGTVAH